MQQIRSRKPRYRYGKVFEIYNQLKESRLVTGSRKWPRHWCAHYQLFWVESCVGNHTALNPHFGDDLSFTAIRRNFFSWTGVWDHSVRLLQPILCPQAEFRKHKATIFGYDIGQNFSLEIN